MSIAKRLFETTPDQYGTERNYFLREGGAMRGGPVFVERIDYEAAVAYLETHLPEDVRPYADRMATETIAAALVGAREATEEQGEDVALGIWFPIRRFVTDWEEVDER